jgi:hypothetical protein
MKVLMIDNAVNRIAAQKIFDEQEKIRRTAEFEAILAEDAANEDDYFWSEDEFDDGEDSLDDNGDSCFCEMQECSKDGGCPECGETDDEKLDLVHGDHGYRCMTCDATFTCP